MLIEDQFIDSALDFLFGIPMSSQTKESDAEKTKILAAFQEMFLGMSRRVRRGKLRVFYRDAKFDKACSEVQEFATKYVTQAMEVVKKKVNSRAIHGRYIFVHEMARTISDPIFIRDNLLAVYLAGHESIATLLKNCMFHVFRRPDVWNKLRQEVLSVDKDQPVTFEFLKSLRYLHWVVNECELSLT
jgi:cytochrome P450